MCARDGRMPSLRGPVVVAGRARRGTEAGLLVALFGGGALLAFVWNACLRWRWPAPLRARLRHAWRAGRPPSSEALAGQGLFRWRCLGVALCWRLSGMFACGGVGRLRCLRAFGTLGGRDALPPEALAGQGLFRWRCLGVALCWRLSGMLACGGVGRLRCLRAFGTLWRAGRPPSRGPRMAGAGLMALFEEGASPAPTAARRLDVVDAVDFVLAVALRGCDHHRVAGGFANQGAGDRGHHRDGAFL